MKSLEGLRALPKEELAGLCHLYTLLEKTKIPEGEPVVEVSLRSSLDRLTPMSDNLHITSDLTTATEQDFQVELQTWLRQDVSQKITLLLDLSRSDFIRTLNKALRKHPNIAARITCLRNRQRGSLSKEFNSLVTTIKEVQELDLSKIELISETAVKAISNLPKVSKLSLANSKLQKSSNLSLLAHMPLQKLDLTHTGIGRKPTQGFLRQLNHMHPNTSLELTMAGEKFSSHKLSEVCKTLKLQVISSANYLPQDSAFRTLGFRKTLESTA